jgi:hypothetical protein
MSDEHSNAAKPQNPQKPDEDTKQDAEFSREIDWMREYSRQLNGEAEKEADPES